MEADRGGHDEFDLRRAERRGANEMGRKIKAGAGADAGVFIPDVKTDVPIGELRREREEVERLDERMVR